MSEPAAPATFGERLRYAREKAHLTIGQLAKAVVVTEGAIRQMESGQTKSASLRVGLRLARVLKCSPEWLACEIDDDGDPPGRKVRNISTARKRRQAKWGDQSLDPVEVNSRIPRPASYEPGFSISDAPFTLAASPYLGLKGLELLLRSPKMANNSLRAMQRVGELPATLPDSTPERAILENRFDLLTQMDEMDQDQDDQDLDFQALLDVLGELLSDRVGDRSIGQRLEERRRARQIAASSPAL